MQLLVQMVFPHLMVCCSVLIVLQRWLHSSRLCLVFDHVQLFYYYCFYVFLYFHKDKFFSVDRELAINLCSYWPINDVKCLPSNVLKWSFHFLLMTLLAFRIPSFGVLYLDVIWLTVFQAILACCSASISRILSIFQQRIVSVLLSKLPFAQLLHIELI